MVYIHSGIFSVIQNQVILLKEKGMKLETIMLWELSQFQKDKYQTFSLVVVPISYIDTRNYE